MWKATLLFDLRDLQYLVSQYGHQQSTRKPGEENFRGMYGKDYSFHGPSIGDDYPGSYLWIRLISESRLSNLNRETVSPT